MNFKTENSQEKSGRLCQSRQEVENRQSLSVLSGADDANCVIWWSLGNVEQIEVAVCNKGNVYVKLFKTKKYENIEIDDTDE